MKTVLVTGAGGYIGSITSRQLLAAGYRIVAADNFSRGYREPLEKLAALYPGRLVVEDLNLVFESHKLFNKHPEIGAVMHFAALLNVGESMKIPVEYFSNNVVGTQNLLEATVGHGVRHLVFSSSCTVYGNAQYLPIDEAHPISKPESVYGQTKRICEDILEWYDRLGKLRYAALRYFNVCGATDDGEFGDSKRPSFHLMQNAVRGALGLQPFRFNYAAVNTPDGSPVRDYVNVVDLADAHVAALAYLERTDTTQAFNLGTGTGNSVLEIVNKVQQITGRQFEVDSDPDRRTGEADKMVANYAKARELLGWEPRRSLEQSVQSLVTWYGKYPGGWRR
ncbi:MAG: UDP-glucose 4-epimerase GalE [Meiothermus sp.]|nr:UDP-glucose 4-epimerase GalE [Meiothermus sp.]